MTTDRQGEHHFALYRVWRPMRFQDVVGQDHVTRTLQNAIVGGRIAHAYLFCGPRGTGKTSVAKILARAVNCLEGKGGEPCGGCEACRAVTGGQALDVLELDAASHRGIEEIRDLRDKARYSPASLKRKVYIIDEVHMLTPEAFNALLKILEEPPSHVLFVLATTDPQKIPATIISRCQRFDFHRLNRDEIVSRLREVCDHLEVAVEDVCLDQIAVHAEGGLRDALSLLDQCLAFAEGELKSEHLHQLLGTAEREEVAGLARALIVGDVPDLLSRIGRVYEQGREPRQVLRGLVGFLRDVLLHRVAPGEGAGLADHDPLAAEQARNTPVSGLLSLLQTLSRLETDMRWAVQPRLSLEIGLVAAVVSGRGDDAHVVVSEERAPATGVSAEAAAETAVALDAAAPETDAPATDTPPAGDSAPENVAPATGAVEEEAGKPSLQHIIEAWAPVRDRVKKKRRALHALLEPARPALLRGNTLVLAFGKGYGFHRDRVSEASNRDYLEQVLAEMLGMELHVNCVLQGEAVEGKGASERGGEPGGEVKTGAASESGNEAEPIKELLDEFGGKVVDHDFDTEKGDQ